MRKVLRFVALFGVAAALAGLGVVLILSWTPRKYHVQGTITRDGKPLEWKGEKRVLQIIFAPFDHGPAHRDLYRCVGDPDKGTYALEVPAGKYRVSIQQLDPYPTVDLLSFAYGIGNSDVIRPIAGDCTIDIDLPRDLPGAGGPKIWPKNKGNNDREKEERRPEP
jgi:hypothetical protein